MHTYMHAFSCTLNDDLMWYIFVEQLLHFGSHERNKKLYIARMYSSKVQYTQSVMHLTGYHNNNKASLLYIHNIIYT